MKTKICTKCKNEYPLTSKYFHRDKYNKDGFSSQCKNCRTSSRKTTYKNNKLSNSVLSIEELYSLYREKYGNTKVCSICKKNFQ